MSTQQRNILVILVIAIVGAVVVYMALQGTTPVSMTDDGTLEESAGEQKMPEKFAPVEETGSSTSTGNVRAEYASVGNTLLQFTTTASGNVYHGQLALKTATLSTRNGHVEGGEFVIDMSSVQVKTGGDGLADVESNLKNKVLNVGTYPEAKLVITSVTPNTDESVIQGDLTMNGITKTVTFLARVGVTDTQSMVKGQMFVDMTLWNLSPTAANFDSMLGIQLDIQLKK